MDILQALIDADIMYSTPEEGKAAQKREESVFNARTLEKAILGCNGTVGEEIASDMHGRRFTPRSFLDQFAASCGTAKLDEVIEILEPIHEAETIANGFLKTYAQKYEFWKKKYLKNRN